ncbi:conjugal transfer protein TraB [Streptomyces sp. NPDC059708]|uniref:conjugal transfer protein TraB n=1 Tax=Streptomyces sp. NPDC059708 TaxID=3346916 RepID=UPI0036CEA68B
MNNLVPKDTSASLMDGAVNRDCFKGALEPRPVRLPAVHSGGGRTPSFLSLAGRLALLSAAAVALKEGLWELRHRMARDASRADQLAEMCAAAEVEPAYTALIHEAGRSLRAVADASAELADAADEMEFSARGAADAHETEYRGVYEAVQASGARQAKPGFYRSRS